MGVVLLGFGIALSLSASASYIFHTLRGSVKPNRVSWLMFSVAAGVGVWVTFRAGGDTLVVLRLVLAAIMPLIVFLASFRGHTGYWKLSFFDFGCGALSLISIVLWLLYADASLSITFAGLADFFACLPTIRKAWKAPETESALSFFIFTLSTIVVLPLVTIWDIVHAGFALYLTIVNALIFLLIAVRSRAVRVIV